MTLKSPCFEYSRTSDVESTDFSCCFFFLLDTAGVLRCVTAIPFGPLFVCFSVFCGVQMSWRGQYLYLSASYHFAEKLSMKNLFSVR